MRKLWEYGAAGLLVVLSLLTAPAAINAATYYVDALAGDDGNPGISQSAAWKSIPGTYKTDNSGFNQGSGWVKIKAGDVILVKAGSAFGTRLVIDGTWYENGTRDSHIKIARDGTWGSGPVTFDGGGQTLGQWDSLIFINKVNYLDIDGGEPAGIFVKNSRNRGFAALGNSEGDKMAGLSVKNVKFFNSTSFNLVLQRQDSFVLENVEVDGAWQPNTGGFYVGDQTYACSNGKLINCKSYNNGANPGAQEGGTDARMGFWCTNSTNILFQGCVAHHNEGRGFDVGTVGSPISTVTNNITFLNCLSYNNSAGFGCNLDDLPGDAKFWFINCVARDNGTGWNIYQGPTAYIYNCVSARNWNGFYLDTLNWGRPTTVTIKNTIVSGSKSNTIYAHDCQTLKLYTDYNLYERGDGDDVVVRWYDAPGGENSFKVYGYGGEPNLATWRADRGQDAHSSDSGEGKSARFEAADRNNFHLAGGSNAIGAGADLSGEWPGGVPTADKNGQPRQGSAWDMGAYISSSPAQASVDE